MDSFRLNDVFNIVSRIAFGSVIVLPLSLSNYNLSHQEGLSLKYSKTSPPLAIFDDERITEITDNESASSLKREHFQTNRLQTRQMVQKISRRFSNLQKESLKVSEPKIQARYLAGMNLQKSSPTIVAIKGSLNQPSRSVQLNSMTLKKTLSTVPQKTQASALKAVADYKHQQQEAEQFIAGLNPRLRERAQEIENFDEVLNEDYTAESFADRAKVLVAEELAKADRADLEKDISVGVKSAPVMANRKSFAQRMEAASQRNDISRNFARSGHTKYVKGSNNRPATQPPPNDPVEKEISDKSTEKGVAVAARGNVRQVIMSGTLEMTKGLALAGDQQIVVYRQIGGTKYGYGQVIIDEGRYEILVNEPNTGVVIAELLEGDTMIGRAEVLMPEVMLNSKTPEDFKNIPIKLEPILDQVVAENISAYSYYKKEKIKNSHVKIGDTLDAQQRIFNSTIVMKTAKENHWGNIILGSSKNIFTNVLNPDATIQALKDILEVKALKEQIGIIKGDISIAGQPVSGAQIEVVGMGQETAKPVYFNSFIPDPTLEETTSNGHYAVVGLSQGSYLVRAKYKGKYLSPQLAPVEAGFITQVNFDVQKPSLAEAFVFDIQSSEMMSAQIGFLGSEQKVPVQTRKLISFSGHNGVQFLEVQAQDPSYYATRMTVDKSEKEILIPMISENWLSGLLARLKVNTIPDTGLIIGTAHELAYMVELDPNAYNEDTKIVYFDGRGQLVPGGTYAPQGGGFVAINVNPGIRSLFNKYQGTKNLKITTMAVDNSAVNVFNSKF